MLNGSFLINVIAIYTLSKLKLFLTVGYTRHKRTHFMLQSYQPWGSRMIKLTRLIKHFPLCLNFLFVTSARLNIRERMKSHRIFVSMSRLKVKYLKLSLDDNLAFLLSIPYWQYQCWRCEAELFWDPGAITRYSDQTGDQQNMITLNWSTWSIMVVSTLPTLILTKHALIRNSCEIICRVYNEKLFQLFLFQCSTTLSTFSR